MVYYFHQLIYSPSYQFSNMCILCLFGTDTVIVISVYIIFIGWFIQQQQISYMYTVFNVDTYI